MKSSALTLALACVLQMWSFTPMEAEASAKSAVDLSDSIVRVRAVDPGGLERFASGVVVAPQQVVSTCHSFPSLGELWITARQSPPLPATLKYGDLGHDLCLFQVPGLAATPIKLGASRTLKNHANVVAIAYEGDNPSQSSGTVLALRPIDEALYIQTSIRISPAQSGGGLFDAQGSLVGILNDYLPDEGLNFAAPAEWIKDIPGRSAGGFKFVVANEGSERLSWLKKSMALEKKKDWAALAKWARRWAAQEPGDRWAWFSQAIAYLNLDHYCSATQAYRRGLAIKPDYAPAWANLGTAYARLGDFANAEQAYRNAVKWAPRASGTWTQLGMAREALGDYTGAIAAYREALRLAPLAAPAWYALGNTYSKMGQAENAEYSLLKAVRNDVGFANAWYNLGVLYVQTRQGKKLAQVLEVLDGLAPDKAAQLRE